jgi:phage terminase large subunit
MSILDIGKFYCTLKFNDNDEIIADSAEPKSIDKLSKGWQGQELSEQEFLVYPKLSKGFNIKGARKGQDSVRHGINIIESVNFFVVEESVNYWNEVYSYVYAQDKNGNYTDEPIDDFNHLIDPTRGVLLELETERDDWQMERAN